MSDDVDAIQDRDAPLQEFYLRFRHPVPEITGKCLFCAEPVPQGRYCDTDCRKDWEQEQFMLKQKFRPR